LLSHDTFLQNLLNKGKMCARARGHVCLCLCVLVHACVCTSLSSPKAKQASYVCIIMTLSQFDEVEPFIFALVVSSGCCLSGTVSADPGKPNTPPCLISTSSGNLTRPCPTCLFLLRYNLAFSTWSPALSCPLVVPKGPQHIWNSKTQTDQEDQ
jgi:hypothetical protein